MSFARRAKRSAAALAIFALAITACGKQVGWNYSSEITVPPPPETPGTEIAFAWTVQGGAVDASPFVPAAGPPGSTGNFMSRLQVTPSTSFTLWRRQKAGSAVELLEVQVANDPLVCLSQSAPGAMVQSQLLASDISITISNGRMWPLLPAISSFVELIPGRRYKLELTQPAWKRIADGAAYVWPFVVTSDTSGAQPVFADLKPIFPANPGSMWVNVSSAFPPKTPEQMDTLSAGASPFDSSGDPWALQGKDEKYTPTTGYHGDWPWCHLGAYYANDDVNDLLYVVPTVYRQAARPVHYFGLDAQSNAFWFNFARPGIWSTNYLGRVPTGANSFFMAPIADTHDWTGPDHQHASMRRVGEYAESTGSPWAWAEMIYYGELAKGMLRTIDPQPFGQGFPNTPRAYLAWLEMAYRAWRLDSTYDMTVAIKSIEDYLELSRDQSWSPGWGFPQPIWAQIADTWIPGHYAAASFEDLRMVPILLKV
ncbi:MAG TPA: hypothetical protein VKE69_01775, partial [Planctomycetota bacterium]|nr:hypothetical protein [Planctomycetota bacterium]